LRLLVAFLEADLEDAAERLDRADAEEGDGSRPSGPALRTKSSRTPVCEQAEERPEAGAVRFAAVALAGEGMGTGEAVCEAWRELSSAHFAAPSER